MDISAPKRRRPPFAFWCKTVVSIINFCSRLAQMKLRPRPILCVNHASCHQPLSCDHPFAFWGRTVVSIIHLCSCLACQNGAVTPTGPLCEPCSLSPKKFLAHAIFWSWDSTVENRGPANKLLRRSQWTTQHRNGGDRHLLFGAKLWSQSSTFAHALPK